MAIHSSPGVYFQTLDFSNYATSLASTILALVGTSEKGPTDPTYISSITQFTNTFGTPRSDDFSCLAAISYLEFGSALWYKRLVGPNATKASVEIPRAREIKDESIGVVDNTNKYIYTATLNNRPVPGTVEIVIYDPDDTTNKIVIKDNDTGVFSPYLNSDISEFPNFVDYDNGDYRFTLNPDVVSTGDIVKLKYNKRDYSVENLAQSTIEQVSVNRTYSGTLKHSNIILPVTHNDLRIKLTDITDTYTLVTDADVTFTGTTYNLNCIDGASTIVGTGTLNIATGDWTLTFDGTHNLASLATCVATYTYNVYKIKTLGTVGDDFVNSSGEVVGICDGSYIGSINAILYPTTIDILVNNDVVATDNGLGEFTGAIAGNIVACTNTINYNTKVLNIALITPPTEGFKIIANYMAKYETRIQTVGSEGTYGDSLSYTLDMFPVVKNSVEVIAYKRVVSGETVTWTTEIMLTDNGEGQLISSLSGSFVNGNVVTAKSANGTIDYDTGLISINYNLELTAGSYISVSYLNKLGYGEALYFGKSYNGTTFEFYKDPYYGYGIKIWGPSQLTTETPEEIFKSVDFEDENSGNYFVNKGISNYITFVLNNNSDDFVSSVPILNKKLVITGGDDDEEHITKYSAITALSDFANTETYDINLIAVPDFPGDKEVALELIELAEVSRGDCFALIDPPRNLTVQNVVDWHNGSGRWAKENALNSANAALYYPWVQITNTFNNTLQWVPPSVKIVSIYSYNDSKAEVWFAPAGLNRGRLFTTSKVELQLNVNDRDLLYSTDTNAVNPICDFVGDGIVVYGQKTLQRKPSALNRVNVSRLLLHISKILATAVKYLLFEPHDQLTWIQYTQLVNPLLSDIKDRRGLYTFKVVCDSTTNTSYNIDNNTMIAHIWLQPTKTAERIVNKFIITPTGATWSDYTVS